MKRIFLHCFEKWWIPLLSSAILLTLSFLFDSVWLLLFGLLFVISTVIFQYEKKRKKTGCLTIIFLCLYLCLFFVWFLSQILFPIPNRIHSEYSKRYENREKIQNIIGVKIPKFKVIESNLVHLRNFDFEFEVQSTIEFKTLLDDNLFNELDSICVLPIPQNPEKESSFFYYSLESIDRCWTKNENEYRYTRHTDFGGKLLHSTDAYFYFTITKGSKTGEIKYGNY